MVLSQSRSKIQKLEHVMKKSEITVLCTVLAILVIVGGWYFSLEEKAPITKVWNSRTEDVSLVPEKELGEAAEFLAKNADAVIPLNEEHAVADKSQGLLMVVDGQSTELVYVTKRGHQPEGWMIEEDLEYFLPKLKVGSWKISKVREQGGAVMHYLEVKFL